MKKSIFTLIVASTLFIGCDKQNPSIDELKPGVCTFIDIIIDASSPSCDTKVSYEPNADKSTFVFNWDKNDEISIFVPNTSSNDNNRFIATTSDASSPLSGRIAVWEGEQTVYGVYPYSMSGYEFNQDNTSIDINFTEQTIDATTDNRLLN